MNKRYYRPRARNGSESRKKQTMVSLTPAADKGLKQTFQQIGIPEPEPFKPDPFQIEAIEAVKNRRLPGYGPYGIRENLDC